MSDNSRLIDVPGIGKIEFQNVNYSGHTFTDFEPERNPGFGPGWFVKGRNSEKYGTFPDGRGRYVMNCAYPAGKRRRHVHYNCEVQHGFRLKRQAAAVAKFLNDHEVTS